MARKNFEKVVHQSGGLTWSIFPEICKSCGLCIAKCPQKCLHLDPERSEYLGNPLVKCEADKCIACRVCEGTCPDGAIRVEGKR